MTTELEQEFFKVFNIKPIFRYIVQSGLPIIGTDHCRPTYDLTKEQFKNFALSRAKGYKLVEVVKIYPEITDRVLLKLICCVPKTVLNNCTTIKEIKEAVLKDLILCTRKYTAQELKHQIQQLFKGEE